MTPFPIPATVVERLGWVLLHSLWQFTLVALLAFLVIRSLQRCSANVRYWSLLLLLSAMLISPVATFFALPAGVSVANVTDVSSSISVTPHAFRSNVQDLSPPLVMSKIENSPAASVIAERALSGQISALPPPLSAWWSALSRHLHPWLNIIVGAWCVGVIAFACRPVLGWYTVRRLRTAGVTPVSGSIQDLLTRTSRSLRLRQTVRVLQSALVKVPLVVGYFKPLILLPATIVCGLPASQLEAILAHELAHVRRHDYLVNVLQTLIETVFFYHPAVWWISHEIRTERENCCDDIAVALVGNRVEYGRALLALEELRGRQIALAIGAHGGSLLARVQRLFVIEPIQRRPSVADGLVVTSLLLTLALALCFGFSGGEEALAQPPKLPEQEKNATLIPTKQPALRPPEMPDALQMQFHQWDKEFRHTSEENFLVLELAAEELVKKTPDRDQQASIYAQVPHIASQSNITKHVARVQKFARRALELSRDPLQRAHMHGLVGQGIQTDSTIKNEAEKRRLAANSFVTGYAELLAYDIPEVASEPPPDGGFDRSVQDPAAREKQRLFNEAQVAAWKQAHYTKDLVFHRKVLLDLLHWLYHPNSSDRTLNVETQAELRALAAKALPDETAVETFLSKVNQPRILNPEEQARSKTAPGSMLDKEISIHFVNFPLRETLARICTHAGAELELDRDGLKTVGYTANMPVIVAQGRGSVRSALEATLNRYPELSFTRVGKTVFVSTKERVANREKVAQAAVDAVLGQFTGDWRIMKDRLAGPAISQGITFQIRGKTFSRLKDGASYGLGTLEIDPALSPPTFTLQFKDSAGDTGYLSGSYEFRTDGSLSLSVPETDDRPPEGSLKTGQAVHQIRLERIVNNDQTATSPLDQAAEASKQAPSLEFRYVANAPEVEPEPRLPADYLQKHYRDATRRDAGSVKDKGFAWFPISNIKSGDIHVAIERTVETQRLGLLSDVPQHALLADGKWKIAKCVVAPGEKGDKKTYSIMVTLDEAGGKAFQQLTKSHINQQLAIVVGGTIVATPMVRNEIGREVMITGNYSYEQAEQLAATISPDSWKQLFDCTVVDALTGKPIAGNDLTIHFRFQIPTKDDSFSETIDNVVWGPKSSSQVKFVIPPRTLRHPDFDKIVVRWGVSHPDYETYTSPDTIPVSQLLRDEPQSAREALRQIKLTKK